MRRQFGSRQFVPGPGRGPLRPSLFACRDTKVTRNRWMPTGTCKKSYATAASAGVEKFSVAPERKQPLTRPLANRGAQESPASDQKDSFLHGTAADYIDEMHASWKNDPNSVHVSWRTYFRNMQDRSVPATQTFQLPPGLISSRDHLSAVPERGRGLNTDHGGEITTHLKVQQLVRAYQSRGHYHAKTDPLGIRLNAQDMYQDRSGFESENQPVELLPSHYGFSEADMDTHFRLGPGILPRFATESRQSMTLREIIAACESTYCSTYGVEYLHIPDRQKCDWLRERLEVPRPIRFSRDEKLQILNGLIWATSFERFLAAKFPNEKRFGLDGSEGLAPGVMSLIDRSADTHGVENITIGSCHRGRLTMLATVYGKAPEAVFAEFAGRIRADMVKDMAGDVKYHLGHDGHRTTPAGRKVDLSVLANPSHLEAVDPVATGKAFAMQTLLGDDEERKRSICLTLHGDAAIAGQGVVYETLGLSRLPAYNVGGTIRLIVNNQIGFTTDMHHSRSTPYASDIAKAVDAPIFHVNADDVESLVFLCQLAADWRAEFHSDCVVDVVCYRKNGHNEFDQPGFTQPLMYQKVAAQKPCLDQYVQNLVDEGSFTHDEIEEQRRFVWDRLSNIYETSKDYVSERTEFTTAWNRVKSPSELVETLSPPVDTAQDQSVLASIAEKIASVPEDFKLHSNLDRILRGRHAAFKSGSVDWSTAEALAFGSLCLEGHSVRLTGQDVQRGTFSQRHAVVHDQATGASWTPLNNLAPGKQAEFRADNSPLSEFGALGFEYGITLADPNSLVMWEAQFGDFANNTQVIIDNFVAAGETKWLDRSGLVLSLPHGYDGQGAEHSSARLERFLMLCSEEGRAWPEEPERGHQDANIQVLYMTTPANYFHALRRQLRRDFRKPMIILFSKSLLRHPLTRSKIEEFTDSSAFQPVLTDPEHGRSLGEPESIERVIICSGQVFAALQKYREAAGLRNVAITRLEELHPFPWAETKANLDQYPNARTIVWAQEEHYNGGAWHYMRDRLDVVLRQTKHHSQRRVLYAGRGPSASTAAGSKKLHAAEEAQLLRDAFQVE